MSAEEAVPHTGLNNERKKLYTLILRLTRENIALKKQVQTLKDFARGYEATIFHEKTHQSNEGSSQGDSP